MYRDDGTVSDELIWFRQVVNLVTPIVNQYRSLYRCAVQQLSSSVKLQATPIDRSEGVMFRQVGAELLLSKALLKRSASTCIAGHLERQQGSALRRASPYCQTQAVRPQWFSCCTELQWLSASPCECRANSVGEDSDEVCSRDVSCLL